MGISELIKEVKKDKEKFELLVCEMEPLIRKYMKNLYKDDKEEMQAELVAALWGLCAGLNRMMMTLEGASEREPTA